MTGNGWKKNLVLILLGIAACYAIVYVDVVLRAREAWTKGEQFWRWADHPEERAAYLQSEETKELADLDKKHSEGKVSSADYDRDKELLQFRYLQMGKESCIKYAYIWYQTAVQLFSPPDSKWVRLSREKMSLAKERWRDELRAKKIPFEDYMID